MKEWGIEDLEKEYSLDLERAVEEIRKIGNGKVLLQFPDGLKQYARAIKDYLSEKVDAELIIYLGTCFGACDTPAGMENLGIDLTIQFGHNALMPVYLK